MAADPSYYLSPLLVFLFPEASPQSSLEGLPGHTASCGCVHSLSYYGKHVSFVTQSEVASLGIHG